MYKLLIRLNMVAEDPDKNGLNEKIDEMNQIFEELISDARSFSEDFISGIYMYFMMGFTSVISGTLIIWSNRFFIIEGDYVILILAVILMVSGIIILLRGYMLRLKYSSFFDSRKRLNGFRWACLLSSRRSPCEIALELLNKIEEKNGATKWELIKILGNTEQFRHWVENYLLKDVLINEHRCGRVTYYTKTERGELFHKLLQNGNIMKSFLMISGRRLRNR